MKKYPDQVVNTDGDFDASSKEYPTDLGAPFFEPILVDKSDQLKANRYFESRLKELREEYNNLIDDYKWTKLIYEASYNFQPITGEKYHLYEGKEQPFLSLINPNEWDKKHLGTFKLLNNGKWEKI